MPALRFVALDSALVQAWRRGLPDANGQAPERQISDGGGNPCRHCLDDIAEGAPMLVLAHRIKGGAAAVGLNRAAKLAHMMEDVLQTLSDGRALRLLSLG